MLHLMRAETAVLQLHKTHTHTHMHAHTHAARSGCNPHGRHPASPDKTTLGDKQGLDTALGATNQSHSQVRVPSLARQARKDKGTERALNLVRPRRGRPLLSGWLILYRRGGGGAEAKKKLVYIKLTSKFGPL